MSERARERERESESERERERERERASGSLTLVISLVSVLDAKVIALDVQLHIRKDEFLLDKLPDHPKKTKREREEVNGGVLIT